MEVFSNIEAEIERAVQLEADSAVDRLDREIDPLIEQILGFRARNPIELMRQMKFITSLLQRSADDGAIVTRLSARLLDMVGLYLAEGRMLLRNDLSDAMVSMPQRSAVPAAQTGNCPDMARVAVISMEHCFLYCNAAMAGDLLTAPAALVGRPISDFCDMAAFENHYRLHVQMSLAGDYREFEAPGLAGGESESIWKVRLTPLRDIERRITGAIMVAQATARAEVEH